MAMTQTTADRPATKLDTLLNTLDRITDGLQQLDARLGAVVARVVGERQQANPAKSSQLQAVPSGQLGQLEALADRLEDIRCMQQVRMDDLEAAL